MKLTDIEHRVRQVTWPAPPPDLRDRVLSASSVVAQPITWSDRMWFSRAWRLSAAAAVLVCVVVELSGSSRSARVPPSPQALAEARMADDTGREAGLPPAVAAWIARRALFGARPVAIDRRARPALQGLGDRGERR
jgi:hypothetical protein